MDEQTYKMMEIIIRRLEWSDKQHPEGSRMGDIDYSASYQACPICHQINPADPQIHLARRNFTKEAFGHKPDCVMGLLISRLGRQSASPS